MKWLIQIAIGVAKRIFPSLAKGGLKRAAGSVGSAVVKARRAIPVLRAAGQVISTAAKSEVVKKIGVAVANQAAKSPRVLALAAKLQKPVGVVARMLSRVAQLTVKELPAVAVFYTLNELIDYLAGAAEEQPELLQFLDELEALQQAGGLIHTIPAEDLSDEDWAYLETLQNPTWGAEFLNALAALDTVVGEESRYEPGDLMYDRSVCCPMSYALDAAEVFRDFVLASRPRMMFDVWSTISDAAKSVSDTVAPVVGSLTKTLLGSSSSVPNMNATGEKSTLESILGLVSKGAEAYFTYQTNKEREKAAKQAADPASLINSALALMTLPGRKPFALTNDTLNELAKYVNGTAVITDDVRLKTIIGQIISYRLGTAARPQYLGTGNPVWGQLDKDVQQAIVDVAYKVFSDANSRKTVPSYAEYLNFVQWVKAPATDRGYVLPAVEPNISYPVANPVVGSIGGYSAPTTSVPPMSPLSAAIDAEVPFAGFTTTGKMTKKQKKAAKKAAAAAAQDTSYAGVVGEVGQRLPLVYTSGALSEYMVS